MKRQSWAALVSAATLSVVAAGALIAPPAFAAQPSTPEFDPSTTYTFTNVASGLVADLPRGNNTDGAKLWQWEANGLDNQQFFLRATEKGKNEYVLISAGNGKVLDNLQDDPHGASVGQWPGHGGQNQLWSFEPAGNGTYEIRSKHGNKVLEIAQGATANGTPITLGKDVSQDRQRWRVQPVTSAPAPVVITPTASTGANAAGWNNGPVTVSFATPSKDVTVQTRVRGTSDWANTSSVTVSVEGTTVVEYRAVRGGSVVSGSEGSTEIKIDTTAPVSSAASDPASGSVTEGGTVTARFSATDATSGAAYTEFSTDGGATWVRATDAGVSFTAVGSHPVQYRSVDAAGNVEAARTVTLVVTARPATATATITSADQSPIGDWYQKDVYVQLTAPQAGQKIQYRLYGSDWKNYTTPVKVARNGISQLDYRLVSAKQPVAGSEASITVKVDKVVPAVTATRTPASGKGTPAKPVSVTFTPKDLHSGVAKVEYRIDSGAWVTATSAPVVFDKVGKATVSYRAVDVAGNVSAVRTVAVTVTP